MIAASPLFGVSSKTKSSLLLVCLLLFSLSLSNAAADEGWSQDKEIEQLEQLIRDNGWTWQAGPTEMNAIPPEMRPPFIDMDFNEEEALARAKNVLEPLDATDLPSSWDWRNMGGTTPARQQGGCGSCWAFGAVAALESYHKILTGETQYFSEQQCLVCNTYDYDCEGGTAFACYNLWTNYGAVSRTCMPYYGNDNLPCTQDQCEVVARIQGQSYVPYNEPALKTAVMIHPIAVGICATDAMFSYTGSGCYIGPNNTVNHVVELCGWDDSACNGVGAWLVKNSWGTSWGSAGFGWIRFNTCSIGPSAYTLDYVPFEDAIVAYRSHQILDGNGNIDPNETVQMSITATNYGYGTASNVSAVLRSLTPGVTVTDGAASFASMNSWVSSPSLGNHFTIQTDGSVEHGSIIEFEFETTATGGDNEISTFFAFVGEIDLIYENNFDGSISGWTHGATSGTDDWQNSIPATLTGQWDPQAAVSGLKIFGNDLDPTGSDDGHYPNESYNYLQSPVINCSDYENVHLVFSRMLTVEEGIYDVARVLVNGNEIWQNELYDHHLDLYWKPIQYDISAYADNNASVVIRFEIESDELLHFGGWNLDNFQVVAANPDLTAAPESDPVQLTFAISAHPNPFSPSTSLTLAIPSDLPQVSLRIFDPAGRVVSTLHNGSIKPGLHNFDWNGRNNTGQPVGAGIYYVRALAGNQEVSTKLIRVQ